MWWRTSIMILLSQNPSILCWTWVLVFFNTKQVMLTIFIHSKVIKGFYNHTSKWNLVISFWRIIRMWWRMLFTILWSPNPYILCWTWVLDLFQHQAGSVDHLWTFKGEERSCQRCVKGYFCDHFFGEGCCLQYFDHEIFLFYTEHGFWFFLNTKQFLRSNIPLFVVHHSLHKWSEFKPKIDIFEIFIFIWLYY